MVSTEAVWEKTGTSIIRRKEKRNIHFFIREPQSNELLIRLRRNGY
jgi:hypothetical protein